MESVGQNGGRERLPSLGGTAETAVPTFGLQHSRNMSLLRLTLFVGRCYSRRVPFGRGVL
jgi:hypothetical protein